MALKIGMDEAAIGKRSPRVPARWARWILDV